MSALQLGRIWAASPTTPNIDPGVDKWKLGWVAEIPVFQMLNYINNRNDTNIVSLAERGVFGWGSDITYNLSALVWNEYDGGIYISKVASPLTTSRPDLNLTQWEKSSVQISRAQYDAAVANWSNHIANTSNPHQLTTEILNTYSKAVIDQKVATVQTALNNHTGNTTSNVHGVTAVQTGAVPVTGGSYTGLVKHLFASTGIGDASYAATLMTDSTGTFLTLGANPKLGIDSTKKPVFIDDTGSKGTLLIDSNYIAAREAVEANYVAPSPDCEINFRNSLTMLAGAGAVTFTGPAGSRGYTDKSGTAQTAALNAPRYTAKGIYLTGQADAEGLYVPTQLNIQNAPSYTWSFDMTTFSNSNLLASVLNGGYYTIFAVVGSNYTYQSVAGGVPTSYVLAPADHTRNHRFTVVSDAVANKTFVYLDGVLKVTINTKQDVVTGTEFSLSTALNANTGPRYINNFKTWLYALTPQQVSNV